MGRPRPLAGCLSQAAAGAFFRQAPSRPWYLLLLALLGWGCRSAAVDHPLPAAWAELTQPVAPFAALYRLTCCGQRHLPTVVRSAGETLSVSVSVPPGGVAWEGWFDAAGAVARARGERCLSKLPTGRVALPGGAVLPIEAPLWAALLAGRLPPGMAPVAGRPGWLEGRMGGGWLAARCTGEPARCLEVRLADTGEPGLIVHLDRHHGRVPGRLRATAGRDRVVLELVEWGPAGELIAPAWLGWPPCPT